MLICLLSIYQISLSRVVLAKNVNTNEFAAVKVIDINRLKGNDVVIRKEKVKEEFIALNDVYTVKFEAQIF